MNFLYGLLTATGLIIAAEIYFDYSLGDVLKDLFIRLFKGAEAVVAAQVNRAQARVKAAMAKLRKAL